MSLDTTIALVTLQEAKDFLKITSLAEDGIITDLVNSVSQYVSNFIGKNIVSKNYTEYYDGDGTSTLILNNFPVTTLTSVYDDVNREFGSGAQISASDIMLDGKAGMLRLWNNTAAFTSGHGNIKVTYTAGYSSVPSDIKTASLMIISAWYKNNYQFQRTGIQSETKGDFTIQLKDEDIPPQAKTILEKYRSFKTLNGGYSFQ